MNVYVCLIMQKCSRANSNNLTRCDISVYASKKNNIDRSRSITFVLSASRLVQNEREIINIIACFSFREFFLLDETDIHNYKDES
jgi:hypothetical protein